MILDLLRTNIDAILERITISHLERYCYLQTRLMDTDVSSDEEYQRKFNGFYKMGRRGTEWYENYFGLLKDEKRNLCITFEQVLRSIYNEFTEKGRVEPSFASKLVATIRPDEMPIYDKYVRQNLDVRMPGQWKAAEVRLEGCILKYAELEKEIKRLISEPIFTNELRPAFDRKRPAFAHISDVKKLDFLLWQHREVQKATDLQPCSAGAHGVVLA